MTGVQTCALPIYVCTVEWRRGKQAAERFKKKKQTEYNRKYGNEYRLQSPEYHREQKLMKQYGLTLADYNRMFEEQNGVCAICGQPEKILTRTGKIRSLAVDHHHDTGKVRRLLCQGCNQGIGNLRENPEILKKALAYLEEHK